MNQFDAQMTSLADAIKAKNENAAAKLSIAGMIEAVNAIEVGGGASSIEFYECATYTPDADAYTKYTLPLTSAPDSNANTNYVRTKWVEDATGDSEDYITTAQWTAENGYKITEESGWGEFSYSIKNANGNTIYGTDTVLSERVTDYNTIPWVDYDTYESVTLTFGTVVSEDIPAITERWTGYKVTQNAETGVWSKSDVLTEGLSVQHLIPRVGEIFSGDTTIWVRRMYDGSLIPIPQDGLVFYAPLQEDYVDKISGTAATVTGGTFTTHNGIKALQLDGLQSAIWYSLANVPSVDADYSLVILYSPIEQSGWRVMFSMGRAGGPQNSIRAESGRLLGTGGYLTDNSWQSIVMTKSNNTYRLYVNGVLDSSGSLYATMTPPVNICVGAEIVDGGNGGAMCNGYFASAAIYNRALTADEILEIHNNLM